jgi:antitoxin component of RelBE/YafQ-DinJ toxin-antitoxin module
MDTTMLIKTNKVLKQRAQKLAKEMGLPLGTLVNNYLRNFIIDRQAVFNAPMPNKKTIRAIEEARRDIKLGKNLSGPFNTAEEAISYLKKL